MQVYERTALFVRSFISASERLVLGVVKLTIIRLAVYKMTMPISRGRVARFIWIAITPPIGDTRVLNTLANDLYNTKDKRVLRCKINALFSLYSSKRPFQTARKLKAALNYPAAYREQQS